MRKLEIFYMDVFGNLCEVGLASHKFKSSFLTTSRNIKCISSREKLTILTEGILSKIEFPI